MSALWHSVHVSFYAQATPQQRVDVLARYQTLAKECGGVEAGILLFEVRGNLDLRKGVHLVEIAIFHDNAALQRFRNHPKHQELAAVLREIADWTVGDLELPWPI